MAHEGWTLPTLADPSYEPVSAEQPSSAYLGILTGLSRAPLPIGGHVQVALARAPLFIMLHEQSPEQADSRFAVRKDTNDALSATDFLIETLLPIDGAQPLAVGARQASL